METISGKFCPICKFKNDIAATNCAYCGVSLEIVHQGETTTKHVEGNDTKLFTRDHVELDTKGMVPPKKGLAIYLTSGILVEIVEETEFFLGRKSEEGDAAFLDLAPFGAFQLGVSRQHALIKQTKQGYEIVDQGSTNGTFLNGERLVANKPYTLPQSSQVSLGRLHLLMLYGKGTKNKTPKR
jgi:hypothetical protein